MKPVLWIPYDLQRLISGLILRKGKVMKHTLTAVIAAIALCACSQSSSASPSAGPAVTSEPASEPAVPENTPDPRRSSPEALREYQNSMEGYEDLEIVFLGATSIDRPLTAILERAAADGVKPVSDLDDSGIFYGDRGTYSDYVYLIVPASSTAVRVGRYSWNAGEITETWFEEEDALPFIYVESGDSLDPLGRIEYTRRFPDGNTEGFLYTGVTASGKLRTDYHMGVSDKTDYSRFDTAELPVFDQSFMDTLLSYDEISYRISQGDRLTRMEELLWDGHAYMVYDLSGDNGSTVLYGVTVNPLTGTADVIESRDSGMNWSPAGQG